MVLQAGRIVFDGSPLRLFERDSDLPLWGLRRPAAMTMAGTLREGGYDIPEGVVTMDDLVEALAGPRAGGSG